MVGEVVRLVVGLNTDTPQYLITSRVSKYTITLSKGYTTMNNRSRQKFLTTHLTLWCLLLSIHATGQPYGSREALVLVEPIVYANEETRLEAVGTAEARRSVTLYAAVAERVAAVNFKSGDYVTQGAILVQLDDRRQQVALKQAQLNLQDTERTLERVRKNFEQGAVPQSDLDRAKLARDLALVDLNQAQIEVEDRQIIAPFSGYLGLSDIEPGDRINSQTAIATLDDRETLIIDLKVPEAAVSLLATDATLTVQPWRYSGDPVTATVVEKDSRIDPQTRLFRVRAELDNRRDDFLPGTSFRTIIQSIGEEFIAIPEAALSWGPNAPYIWVARDRVARRVPVQIEQRQRGRVLVSGDILFNDLLITEGIQNIREGQALKFKDLPPTGTEAAE